jgi:hypothetical protein
VRGDLNTSIAGVGDRDALGILEIVEKDDGVALPLNSDSRCREFIMRVESSYS